MLTGVRPGGGDDDLYPRNVPLSEVRQSDTYALLAQLDQRVALLTADQGGRGGDPADDAPGDGQGL